MECAQVRPVVFSILFASLSLVVLGQKQNASSDPAAHGKHAPQLTSKEKQQLTEDAQKTTPAPSHDAGKAAAAASNPAPVPLDESDYIPCRFTYGELNALQNPGVVVTLSPADAELLLHNVMSAIHDEKVAGHLTANQETLLLARLTRDGLSGLTPSEALQSIITAVNDVDMDEESKTPEVSNLKVATDAAISAAARQAINRITRPPDVGCSMSVLSYKETSRAFGYIIASNYIALQVVVRNLNRDQQFVVHDVEVAVNTDPFGNPGRFFSGRDKVVVRSLSSAQQSFDPRNIAVHSAQAIGALLSSLTSIYGPDVTAASSVYNAGFFPWFDKVWKDISVDQLNLLNDVGFSSTTSSQTVVPKTSSTMFVTFIPSKQFEKGWWTQPCVDNTILGRIRRNDHRAVVSLLGENPASDQTEGASVSEALQACTFDALHKYVSTKDYKAERKQHNDVDVVPAILSIGAPKDYKAERKQHNDVDVVPAILSVGDPNSSPNPLKLPVAVQPFFDASAGVCGDLADRYATNTVLSDDERDDLDRCKAGDAIAARIPKRLYRQWSGNSISLFQQLSTVVVAGMHVVEDKTLEPELSEMDCPKADTGTGILQFPSPDTGYLVCQLKGKNLGKVNLLRLRSPNETPYVDGIVSVKGGDETVGTVEFKTAALHSLKQRDYTIYLVNKSGVETGTNQSLHFDLGPSITKADPAALNVDVLTKENKATLEIDGYHLENVNGLTLQTSSGKELKLAVSPMSPPSATSLTFVLKPADLSAKLGDTAGKVNLVLNLKDAEKPVSTAYFLTYTPPAVKSVDTSNATVTAKKRKKAKAPKP